MAFTKAGRYHELLFVNGRVAPNTNATIRVAGTSNGAVLYADAAKSSLQGTSVVRTDAAGNLAFYADPGYYDILVGDTTLSGVVVGIDPADVDRAPVAGDAIIYVSDSANASDANSGLSWGSAKATIAAARDALPSTGGIIELSSGIFDTVANSYHDISGKSDLTLRGQGPATVLRIPNAGQGATQYLLNIANQSNVVISDLTLHSALLPQTWSIVIMGAGTLANCRFERVLFKADGYTGGGSQPYMANMNPTAVGGISDLSFVNCRFESAGTAQVAGLLIRGCYGLKIVGNTWVNVNNPLVPDSLFQKQNLIYAFNEEVVTQTVVHAEGVDIHGWNDVIYVGNTQRTTVANPVGQSVGGMILDSGSGVGCNQALIQGNIFIHNPVQVAPAAGAGSQISQVIIKNNIIYGKRTAFPNNCITLYDDPKLDSTSTNFIIEGNICRGTFSGVAIFKGAGYGEVRIRNNTGALDSAVPTESYIATMQSRSATAYGDLATVGPVVALVVPPSGRVRITLTAHFWCDNVGNGAYMSYESSGANVLGAVDANGLYQAGDVAGNAVQMSHSHLLSGLTPGLTTFTAKYRSPSGGGTNWQHRRLLVEPLP